MAAVMILGQSFVWYKQVNKIVLGENKDSNPALVLWSLYFSCNIIYYSNFSNVCNIRIFKTDC